VAKRGEKRRRDRALIDAAVMDDLDGVRALLEQGADVNARDREHGDTPLMLACSDDMRRLLLDHSADIHARNDFGWTAFWRNPCAILLDAGADINAQDSDGWTPLMKAVSRGEFGLVEWRITQGADVDVADAEGVTALSEARDLLLVVASDILKKARANG
jgi:ankyrin repeat protein